MLISSTALARERSRSGHISGTIPYFDGLNTVECSPSRNITSIIEFMLPATSAARPIPMIPTSKTFTQIITRRLLTASARWPA